MWSIVGNWLVAAELGAKVSRDNGEPDDSCCVTVGHCPGRLLDVGVSRAQAMEA